MSKIPIVNFTGGTKRRIEMPLDDTSNSQTAMSNIDLSKHEAKRLNMSVESNQSENNEEASKRNPPNRFGLLLFYHFFSQDIIFIFSNKIESNLFEIEIKSQMMKNATLETQLNSIKIEKKQLQKDFDSFKEEKLTEFKVI
jgi:hypothetical protein